MSLKGDFEKLSYRFMSVADYGEATRSGKLPQRPDGFRGSNLSENYPKKHPMNYDNLSKRKRASHKILELAKSQGTLFTDNFLETIHIHMFDCSPEVRFSLVSALYYVGNSSTLPHIKKLLDIEVAGELPNTGIEKIKSVADLVLRKLVPETDSSEDIVFVLSPNIQLVGGVRDFCINNNMHLWIGEPNTPNVIDIPYKVGIVSKDWLNEESWNKWIEFLREPQGKERDYFLVITLDSQDSERARQELERRFENIKKTVYFASDPEVSHILSIVRKWLYNRTESPEEISPSEETRDHLMNERNDENMTFKDRLEELLNRFPVLDSGTKVNLQDSSKWRIQAKWLFANCLGEEHLYTKELITVLGVEADPFSPAPNILMAKGILEALLEDLSHGFIEMKEEL
jgi:hypothetical protein